MSTLPVYVGVIVLVGLIGTTATTCVMLWRGALTAGLGRRTAIRVATATAIVWAGWAMTSALLAHADVLRFAPERKLPGLAVAVIAGLAVAFLITRVPPVARILAQPDALWGLTLPQVFRPVGGAFLVAMALGRLPALFALPAGLGDIAIGIEAAFVARAIRRGTVLQRGIGLRRDVAGRRTVWLNILGLADLVVAFGIGYAAAPGRAQLLFVWPSTEAISTLPLVLIPTAVVPLAVTLHVLSLRKLWAAVPSGTPTAAPVRSTP
ncbi:MAG: hypothetical protein QOC63_4446 [Mycobacterium sp.]|jgi:hypothetical protein|nr:hypothetical protein [Mycobacterium sp.]